MHFWIARVAQATQTTQYTELGDTKTLLHLNYIQEFVSNMIVITHWTQEKLTEHMHTHKCSIYSDYKISTKIMYIFKQKLKYTCIWWKPTKSTQVSEAYSAVNYLYTCPKIK